MSSTDETKESLREYCSWNEKHREVFNKLLNEKEIFAKRGDWNRQANDPDGIWMGLAKRLNDETNTTTAYTGQQCVYMTKALRARHSRKNLKLVARRDALPLNAVRRRSLQKASGSGCARNSISGVPAASIGGDSSPVGDASSSTPEWILRVRAALSELVYRHKLGLKYIKEIVPFLYQSEMTVEAFLLKGPKERLEFIQEKLSERGVVIELL